MIRTIFILLITSIATYSYADVIKPTLVEVSIYKNHIELEIYTNIEALITGIGTQYKNTTNAPNEAAYDALRRLQPQALQQKFIAFESTFLLNIRLSIGDERLRLTRKNIVIEDVGYTKRPRTSRLMYAAPLPAMGKLKWQFASVYGDNAFRFRFVHPSEYTWQSWQYIDAGTALEIDLTAYKPRSIVDILLKFVIIGFKHVIPLGFDHILFIIAMTLGVRSIYRALIYVSSFTLAHTLTLGLSTYNIVTLEPQIIEPIIAFSIVIMALDKLFIHMRSSYNSILIFCFGLLHGLGFALMLREFISDNILVSLIGFNIGVELAQIMIVFTVVLVFMMIPSKHITLWLSRFIALVIALIAMQMVLSRIL